MLKKKACGNLSWSNKKLIFIVLKKIGGKCGTTTEDWKIYFLNKVKTSEVENILTETKNSIEYV